MRDVGWTRILVPIGELFPDGPLDEKVPLFSVRHSTKKVTLDVRWQAHWARSRQ
jgi:hypothetical protein